jgi:hypothetical protein
LTADDGAVADTASDDVPSSDGASPDLSSPDLSSDELASSDADIDQADVVPDCGVTIADYCGSTGSCQTSAGVVSTRWDEEQGQAASLCANATRVSTTTCGNFGIVTVGQVDSSTSAFYDLSTLALVRISVQSFTVGTTCVAGIGIQDLSCSPDSPPANLCATASTSAP